MLILIQSSILLGEIEKYTEPWKLYVVNWLKISIESDMYWLQNGLPQDAGVEQPRGNLTFVGFQMSVSPPLPWVSIRCQIPTPGDHKLYFL